MGTQDEHIVAAMKCAHWWVRASFALDRSDRNNARDEQNEKTSPRPMRNESSNANARRTKKVVQR